MHSVITYRSDSTIAHVAHYASRYEASEAYDRTEATTGHYVQLRDRFGCLAEKRA
jgi:hypothetical protein